MAGFCASFWVCCGRCSRRYGTCCMQRTPCMCSRASGAVVACGLLVWFCCTEVLFIPEGWFHAVSSDAETLAVNFWFTGVCKQLVNACPSALPYYTRAMMMELLVQNRAARRAKGIATARKVSCLRAVVRRAQQHSRGIIPIVVHVGTCVDVRRRIPRSVECNAATA